MNKPIREGFIEETPALPAPEPEVETVTPPSPAQETWPIVVKLLHKPVRNAKNVPVHELSFREPTGGDINRYGNPVRFDGTGALVIDERKMTAMISALANILPPFLETMDPRDWNSCAYRLRGFFIPDPAAW
jgi:Phage tail assembly chaperone proteins, E, or 41 or 14